MTKLPNQLAAAIASLADEFRAREATQPTEERLVALFREHDYERMECHDHGGLCDQAGCHDLREDQAQHYARVVLALLPQRCAPTEGRSRDLDGRTWDEYPAAADKGAES